MASLESPPPPACSRYVDLPDPGSPTSTTMPLRSRIAPRAEQSSAPGSSLRFSCRPFTVTLVWMPAPLTPNQIRGFWAAWGGWALDGMDSFIYALVLVPALRELLPRSGIPADQSHVGFYGGLLFALFLVGWGCSLVWGPIADRFGRVRTLMFTILCYSLFTFLGAFATSVWMLAAFRLLAGVGIGGEWSMGGTFVAEELPEARRK